METSTLANLSRGGSRDVSPDLFLAHKIWNQWEKKWTRFRERLKVARWSNKIKRESSRQKYSHAIIWRSYRNGDKSEYYTHPSETFSENESLANLISASSTIQSNFKANILYNYIFIFIRCIPNLTMSLLTLYGSKGRFDGVKFSSSDVAGSGSVRDACSGVKRCWSVTKCLLGGLFGLHDDTLDCEFLGIFFDGGTIDEVLLWKTRRKGCCLWRPQGLVDGLPRAPASSAIRQPFDPSTNGCEE